MDTITLAMSKAFTRRAIKGIEVPESTGNIPIAYTLPTDAKDGDICFYASQNTITLEDSGKKIYFDWDELRKKYISGDMLNCNFNSNFYNGKVEENFNLDFSRSDTSYDMFYEFSSINTNTGEEYYKNLSVNIDYTTNNLIGSLYYSQVDINGEFVEENKDYTTFEELPTYIKLPEFDTLNMGPLENKGYLFHGDYQLMKYQGDEWVEVVESGVTEEEIATAVENYLTENPIEGGSVDIDTTLTQEGAAADAKATGDRLTDIEYQTVITDLAFEHKDLPEGEKTVSVQGDGVFGDIAIVGNFTNLIPSGGFNKTFPYRGITITNKGNGYVITGATTQSVNLYFTDNMGNSDIPVSADLIGKTLLHAVFADVANGNASLTAAFLNANKTQISKVSDSLRNRTKEIVVPEETAYLRVGIYCPTNNAYNSEFKYYLVEKDKCQTVMLTDNVAEIQSISETEIHSVPYKHTASYTVTLRKLIDDYAGGGNVTYITPEDFGAFGDGSTDDSTAISECLELASQTGRMVIMAGRYFITSPITITQSGLEIICNDIVYNGTDCAVKIVGRENKIKIHSIVSNGVGLAFEAIGQKSTSYNSVEVNTIASQSHGIVFYRGTSYAHQNIVKFELIRAGGAGCYGICFLDGSSATSSSFLAECNLYGGQIANCEWAVYKVGGLSRCYGFEIEDKVQGGFYTSEEGGLVVYYPRLAESQRDGSLPYFKFTGTNNVFIYLSSPLYLDEIDLSEAIDTYANASGQVSPVHEGKLGTIYGTIFTPHYETGQTPGVSLSYCTKSYLWGKYLIMTPFMSYRKEVTTPTLDTRLLGGKEEDVGFLLTEFSQLPTKFVVNTINTDIYLHESYCAFGFNEFEVEQANGFTCKIYDKLNNLIFDGTEQGNGLYKFNVYKDSTYCANHTSGSLRRDFTGHYWSVTKETTVDDVLAALPTWSGGAY